MIGLFVEGLDNLCIVSGKAYHDLFLRCSRTGLVFESLRAPGIILG